MGEKKYYKAVRKWLEARGYYCGGDMVDTSSRKQIMYEIMCIVSQNGETSLLVQIGPEGVSMGSALGSWCLS